MRDLPERPGCLILDVRMPGASGLDLQRTSPQTAIRRPIVFLTGHGDIAMTVQAMKAGAVDFLTKPVRDQTLLDAVTAAIEKDISQRGAARRVRQHVDRYATLTPREREVVREVVRAASTSRLRSIWVSARSRSSCIAATRRGNCRSASVGQLIRIWESLPAELRGKQSAYTKE